MILKVKKILTYLSNLALVFFLFLNATFAAQETKQTPNPPSNPIISGINNILTNNKDTRLPNIHLGIIVQSLNSGRVLYQYNADQLFTPASVQKLFTATAALNLLKPDFQFTTALLTDGNIVNGILDGNLYLKFNGDPTLRALDIINLFRYLHDKLGVRDITGRVYVDNYAFDNVGIPPGCVWDDLIHSFAAPLNAIIIDHNQFYIEVSPAKKVNEPVIIRTNLPPGVARFINEAYTVNGKKGCSIAVNSNEQNVYLLNGCLGVHDGARGNSLALRDVVPYALALTKQLLQKNNIVFSGSVSSHIVPATARVLVSHESPPLEKIIKHMLKKSDNVFTNAVFKKLGEQYHPPGSWQSGVYAIKKILQEPAQINFNQGLFVDGAGLSRYNLVSPRQLAQLLMYAYHNPTIREHLYVSLPIAGKDGTLAYRMAEEGRSERVHAKTGSMSSVTSLAGYLNTQNNGPLTFAIIVNGFVGSKAPYRALQDRICEFLIRAQHS